MGRCLGEMGHLCVPREEAGGKGEGPHLLPACRPRAFPAGRSLFPRAGLASSVPAEALSTARRMERQPSPPQAPSDREASLPGRSGRRGGKVLGFQWSWLSSSVEFMINSGGASFSHACVHLVALHPEPLVLLSGFLGCRQAALPGAEGSGTLALPTAPGLFPDAPHLCCPADRTRRMNHRCLFLWYCGHWRPRAQGLQPAQLGIPAQLLPGSALGKSLNLSMP